MTTLNKAAAEVVTSGTSAVHSMTDITGFGLLGHAREMAAGAGVSLRVGSSRVPLLTGALECVRADHIPGGLKSNRQFIECGVETDPAVPEEMLTLLYDPQTAGGLLIAVAEPDTPRLLAELQRAGVDAAVIGEVLPKQHPLITVAP